MAGLTPTVTLRAFRMFSAIGATYTLWVVSFSGNASGVMSFGDHSLEATGAVSINAGEVDGRIVTADTQAVSIDTGILDASVTGGDITVAATSITNSTVTAARSATISATQGIAGTTITAQTAQVTAGTAITGGAINAATKTVDIAGTVTTTAPGGQTGAPPPTGGGTGAAPPSGPTTPPIDGNLRSGLAGVQAQAAGNADDAESGGDDSRRRKDAATDDAASRRQAEAQTAPSQGYGYANRYVSDLVRGR